MTSSKSSWLALLSAVSPYLAPVGDEVAELANGLQADPALEGQLFRIPREERLR